MEKNKMSRDQSGYWANRDRSRNKNVLYKKTSKSKKVFGKKYKTG